MNGDNFCSIIARIPLIVCKRTDDGAKEEPFRLPVLLTSEYEGKPTDPSVKLLPSVKITVRTSPIVFNTILRSIFVGSLSKARCYSSSGVAHLPNGQDVFLVSGGMTKKGITHNTGSAFIDALILEDGSGLINLDAREKLSSNRYRTTGEVVRDSAGA